MLWICVDVGDTVMTIGIEHTNRSSNVREASDNRPGEETIESSNFFLLY